MSYVITDSALRRLLSGQNLRLSRGVCSTDEAIHMLGIGKTEFYQAAGSKETKLLPSRKRGKWILSSVKKEFERIHGEKYEDAII
jgi:hypothetical protein